MLAAPVNDNLPLLVSNEALTLVPTVVTDNPSSWKPSRAELSVTVHESIKLLRELMLATSNSNWKLLAEENWITLSPLIPVT